MSFFTRWTRFGAAKPAERRVKQELPEVVLAPTVPDHISIAATAVLENEAMMKVISSLKAEALNEFVNAPQNDMLNLQRIHEKVQIVDEIVTRLEAMRDAQRFAKRSS